jgi:DNA repair protein RecO (recombination protein O)
MPALHTPAIILQSFGYSETSKILRLITRTHGVQSVIAKGALRPKSRFGGVLEPFTQGTASFFLRETRDLHTLAGFELQHSRQQLGSDLVRFGGASLLAELVLRVVSEESDPALFDAVSTALDRVEQAAPAIVQSVVLAETWALIAQLGFAPALEQCLTCGRGLEERDEAMFDYPSGGVRCLYCAAGQGGRMLPAAARMILLRLAAGEPVPLERTAAHWRLLARFLSHHVLEGQTLRSLAFIGETLQTDE